MRILICGCRNFKDEFAIRQVLEKYNPEEDIVIHGGARGADTIADQVAEEMGFEVLEYPALWDLYGKAAGPIRNSQMLRSGRPDIAYAFYTDKEKSKGTRDMVARARRAGVKVIENK